MRSVNKVILIGNLTRDPVIKSTTSDRKVVTFTLATNREWVANGERQSLAEFHNIAVWGRLADVCEKYLKKGKLVYIEGYLKTRSWDNPDGTRVFRTEVVAYDMIMLNKKGEEIVMGEGIDQDDAAEESSSNASSNASLDDSEINALDASLDDIDDYPNKDS